MGVHRDAHRMGRAAIAQQVTPAYAKWLTFFREEYLPNTRTSLGASEFPEGAAYYAQQIRQYTTLDLTAEQIHRIGLDEVARITAEMEKVKDEAGFAGTLAEFVTFLRTDPQFVARSGDELMGVSSYVAKRVDGKLADYFGFLPRHRFTIRPVDPGDVPALCDLLNEVIRVGGATIFERPITVEAFIDHFFKSQIQISFLVAAADTGELLGFQVLLTHEQLPDDWADIATFARIGEEGDDAVSDAEGVAVLNARAGVNRIWSGQRLEVANNPAYTQLSTEYSLVFHAQD